MKIIDGKSIAASIRTELAQKIAAARVKPGLSIVLVGNRADSREYVMRKERAASEIGMRFKTRVLPEDATCESIIAAVREFNSDTGIHGIIVQLPLPDPRMTADVINAINPAKDADGMTAETREHLKTGLWNLIPVHCRVVMRVLAEAGCALQGKRMAMLVKSTEPYEAFESIFTASGAETMRVHPDDPELAHKLRAADVIFSLPGRPGLVTADMVKPGAIVIDFDSPLPSVDFEAVKTIASAITPVPGGCGPLTVAYLLQNTFELSQQTEHE